LNSIPSPLFTALTSSTVREPLPTTTEALESLPEVVSVGVTETEMVWTPEDKF